MLCQVSTLWSNGALHRCLITRFPNSTAADRRRVCCGRKFSRLSQGQRWGFDKSTRIERPLTWCSRCSVMLNWSQACLSTENGSRPSYNMCGVFRPRMAGNCGHNLRPQLGRPLSRIVKRVIPMGQACFSALQLTGFCPSWKYKEIVSLKRT